MSTEVIEGVAPRDLEKELTGKTIKAACRKGKQMWLDLGPDAPALLLHFGALVCNMLCLKFGAYQ